MLFLEEHRQFLFSMEDDFKFIEVGKCMTMSRRFEKANSGINFCQNVKVEIDLEKLQE